MIYLERIWRGLQLALDFYFIRLFAIELLNPALSWYLALIYWAGIGAFVAMAVDDFMLLKDLLRKPRKKHGAAAD